MYIFVLPFISTEFFSSVAALSSVFFFSLWNKWKLDSMNYGTLDDGILSKRILEKKERKEDKIQQQMEMIYDEYVSSIIYVFFFNIQYLVCVCVCFLFVSSLFVSSLLCLYRSHHNFIFPISISFFFLSVFPLWTLYGRTSAHI